MAAAPSIARCGCVMLLKRPSPTPRSQSSFLRYLPQFVRPSSNAAAEIASFRRFLNMIATYWWVGYVLCGSRVAVPPTLKRPSNHRERTGADLSPPGYARHRAALANAANCESGRPRRTCFSVLAALAQESRNARRRRAGLGRNVDQVWSKASPEVLGFAAKGPLPGLLGSGPEGN